MKKQLGILVIVLVFVLMVVGCEDDEYTRIVTGVVATLMEGATPRQDSVHITWNRAPEATHYELAYRTEMDSLDTRIGIRSSITDTVFIHNSFIRNRGALTYYVRAHGTRTDRNGVRTRWTGPWAMSSLVEVRP